MMNVLLLPPRFTGDSISIAKAAAKLGWEIERLSSWHIPPLLAEEDVCIYAEPLFAIHASSHLNLCLIEPSYDWLALLPQEWLRREVQLMTMDKARGLDDRKIVTSSPYLVNGELAKNSDDQWIASVNDAAEMSEFADENFI